MGSLPGEQFHVYIARLADRKIGLPKFMIVPVASNASKSIIHTTDDESYMLEDEGAILAQGDKGRYRYYG